MLFFDGNNKIDNESEFFHENREIDKVESTWCCIETLTIDAPQFVKDEFVNIRKFILAIIFMIFSQK